MQSAVKHSCILRVPGDPSPSYAGQFERMLFAGVADHPARLVLDCGDLERVVSSHVTLLWRANSLCQEAGVELRLLNPPLALMRVLNVLDLAHTFRFEGGNEADSSYDIRDMVAADLPRAYSDSACADVNDIDQAIKRFVPFLDSLGVSATTALEVKTIYYEVATNIRCHSGLAPDDRFAIEVRADHDGLTMTFADSGRPFDPTSGDNCIDPKEAARTGKRRGFGIVMIRRLSDRLEYRRDESRGNVLTVVKGWRR